MPDALIAPSGPRQSWDRQPTESKRAWTAFQIFRDSADRKLINVAASLSPPCSVQNVSRWSQRHQWGPRSADYDVHVDELDRAEIARGRSQSRKRRLAVARALQEISAHAIRELQERIAQRLPLNMTPEGIALLSKAAMQLEESVLVKESQFTKINLIVGSYRDEEQCDAAMRGDGPAAPNYDDEMTVEEFQRRQYERLSDGEKSAQDRWHDPPPKLTN